MKAIEQHFPGLLFSVLYKAILTFEFVDESGTIQRKAIDQYFPLLLFIMVHNVALTFESVSVINQIQPVERYIPVVPFTFRSALTSEIYL